MRLKLKYLIFLSAVSFFISSCNDPLEKYRTNELHSTAAEKTFSNKTEELFYKNLLNINGNYPFYIIRPKAQLLLKKPESASLIPDAYITLSFGDVLFPVKETDPVKYYFYVRTADNKYGWIHSSFGISLNYAEDTNLYFFNNEYYLKSYIDAKGEIDNANKLILLKNVIPMLLGNFSTPGWFYPNDNYLALDLSNYGVSIAVNDQVFFYTAFSVQYWRYNEIVTANNLLADSYQKLKNYSKAEEIHNMLISKYFWQRSYNSEVGGLTSIIKLQIIFLEQLKNEKIGSEKYNYFKNKIIENILKISNDKIYMTMTSKDFIWKGQTFTEWVLDILRRNVTREEFYDFCKVLLTKTDSEGFMDMIAIYCYLEKIKEGKKEEAIQFLSTYKPKEHYNNFLRLNDWLSVNKILPDSIIYKYDFN